MILDSQSVRGAETVGAAARGFDAGKKINGRKRHLVVDMRGMPLQGMVAPATNRDAPGPRSALPPPTRPSRGDRRLSRLRLRRRNHSPGEVLPRHDPAHRPRAPPLTSSNGPTGASSRRPSASGRAHSNTLSASHPPPWPWVAVPEFSIRLASGPAVKPPPGPDATGAGAGPGPVDLPVGDVGAAVGEW
ncbi:transposase [Streptomyces sp. Ru73]|uniref:transposase n=1 Tax=Streptomyces sp. Ru73 TaxID=2080748 RepID=UPI0015E2BDFC